MKTFGDLCTFISNSHVERDLFGCDAELDEAFSERCRAVGSALRQERNMTSDKVMELPADTELGEKSRALAENLKAWFNQETASKR